MNTRTLFTPTTNAISQVRNEVERMFDNAFPFSSSTRSYPTFNMIEDEDRVYVEAEMPGVRMEDLEITVTNGMLTISGRREVTALEDASMLRRERKAIEFERSLSLPNTLDASETEAVLRDGILVLTMPKVEKAKARRVEVTRG
jgi:HSP20 family protein